MPINKELHEVIKGLDDTSVSLAGLDAIIDANPADHRNFRKAVEAHQKNLWHVKNTAISHNLSTWESDDSYLNSADLSYNFATLKQAAVQKRIQLGIAKADDDVLVGILKHNETEIRDYLQTQLISREVPNWDTQKDQIITADILKTIKAQASDRLLTNLFRKTQNLELLNKIIAANGQADLHAVESAVGELLKAEEVPITNWTTSSMAIAAAVAQRDVLQQQQDFNVLIQSENTFSDAQLLQFKDALAKDEPEFKAWLCNQVLNKPIVLAGKDDLIKEIHQKLSARYLAECLKTAEIALEAKSMSGILSANPADFKTSLEKMLPDADDKQIINFAGNKAEEINVLKASVVKNYVRQWDNLADIEKLAQARGDQEVREVLKSIIKLHNSKALECITNDDLAEIKRNNRIQHFKILVKKESGSEAANQSLTEAFIQLPDNQQVELLQPQNQKNIPFMVKAEKQSVLNHYLGANIDPTVAAGIVDENKRNVLSKQIHNAKIGEILAGLPMDLDASQVIKINDAISQNRLPAEGLDIDESYYNLIEALYAATGATDWNSFAAAFDLQPDGNYLPGATPAAYAIIDQHNFNESLYDRRRLDADGRRLNARLLPQISNPEIAVILATMPELALTNVEQVKAINTFLANKSKSDLRTVGEYAEVVDVLFKHSGIEPTVANKQAFRLAFNLKDGELTANPQASIDIAFQHQKNSELTTKLAKNKNKNYLENINNPEIAKVLAEQKGLKLDADKVNEINDILNAKRDSDLEGSDYNDVVEALYAQSGIPQSSEAEAAFDDAFHEILVPEGIKAQHLRAAEIDKAIKDNSADKVISNSPSGYQKLIDALLRVEKTEKLDPKNLSQALNDSPTLDVFLKKLNVGSETRDKLRKELSADEYREQRTAHRNELAQNGNNAEIRKNLLEVQATYKDVRTHVSTLAERTEKIDNSLKKLTKSEYQGKSSKELRGHRDQYQDLAQECLSNISYLENAKKELEAQKELTFFNPTPPGHKNPNEYGRLVYGAVVLQSDIDSELRKIESAIKNYENIHAKVTQDILPEIEKVSKGVVGLYVAEHVKVHILDRAEASNMDSGSTSTTLYYNKPSSNLSMHGGAPKTYFELAEKPKPGQVLCFDSNVDKPPVQVTVSTSRSAPPKIVNVPIQGRLIFDPYPKGAITGTSPHRLSGEWIQQGFPQTPKGSLPNEELISAQMNMAMRDAIQVVLSYDPPPSKDHPINIEGGSVESQKFMLTALLEIGRTSDVKFASDAIKIDGIPSHKKFSDEFTTEKRLGRSPRDTFTDSSIHSKIKPDVFAVHIQRFNTEKKAKESAAKSTKKVDKEVYKTMRQDLEKVRSAADKGDAVKQQAGVSDKVANLNKPR